MIDRPKPHETMPNTGPNERRPIKPDVGPLLPGPFTRAQAKRYGDRHMRADLKRAGFETVLFGSNIEDHGSLYFRINYGKKV